MSQSEPCISIIYIIDILFIYITIQVLKYGT